MITKQIKKELVEAHGCRPRDLSVQQRWNTIHIGIHDPRIEIDNVRKIARKYEILKKCSRTSEILLKGSLFVNVTYSERATEYTLKNERELIDRIAETASQVTFEESRQVHEIRIGYIRNALCISRNDGIPAEPYPITPESSRSIAKALVEIGMVGQQPPMSDDGP